MFFPLCWLFNYIWVGKACIYGALTECEPVQLKCLQANAQRHKAVPLGLLHSSTRLYDCWVPALKGRPVYQAHWHMPANTSGGRLVCVKPGPRPVLRGHLGECGRKTTRLTPGATFENLYLGYNTFKPTCWLEIYFHGHSNQLPKLAVRVVSATWGCSLRDAGKLGGWNASKVHGGTALGHTD